MIKVVHLTSAHGCSDIRIFFKECKSLHSAGYHVVLIAPSEVSKHADEIFIHAVPVPKNRFHRIFFTTLKVFRAALKEKADIYHIHDPELLVIGQVMRILGKTVIYDMHENVPEAILTKPWIPLILRKLISRVYRRIERFLLIGMPVIFAEHSYKKDYLWPKKSVTVLNMPIIDSLAAVKESKHSVPTVGYIGVVSPERGMDVTFEAIDLLERKGHNVNFECVGPLPEDYKAYLLNKTGKLKSNKIALYGYMLPTAGWRIIARCHVGLAVLKPVPNYVNSYPTKIFEYMSLGIPVIASDFPLYREIVEGNKCGLCINPENPAELADAILWLMTNPDKAQIMGQHGKNAALSKYQWNNEAQKLVQFYKCLKT